MALSKDEKNARRRKRYAEKKAAQAEGSIFVQDAMGAIVDIRPWQERLKIDGTDRQKGKNSNGSTPTKDTGISASGLAKLRANYDAAAIARIRTIRAGIGTGLVPPWAVVSEISEPNSDIVKVRFEDGTYWAYSTLIAKQYPGAREIFLHEVWKDATGKNNPPIMMSPNTFNPHLNYRPSFNIVTQIPVSLDESIIALKRVYVRIRDGKLTMFPVSTATSDATPAIMQQAMCKKRGWGEALATGTLHHAPQWNCECGWHATKLDWADRNQGIGQSYRGDDTYENPRLRVELFGTIIEHEEGYRAEYQMPVLLDCSERPERIVPAEAAPKTTCGRCGIRAIAVNCYPIHTSDELMNATSFKAFDYGAYTYNVVLGDGSNHISVQMDFDNTKSPTDKSAYSIKGHSCRHTSNPAKNKWLFDNYSPSELAREIGVPVLWSDGKLYK